MQHFMNKIILPHNTNDKKIVVHIIDQLKPFTRKVFSLYQLHALTGLSQKELIDVFKDLKNDRIIKAFFTHDARVT